MKNICNKELLNVLNNHKIWLDTSGVEGEKANLSKTDLSGAFLSKVDLKKADLTSANFAEADLSKVDLREAKLEGVDFRGAILEHANLRGADLTSAKFTRTNLRKANLRGTDLRGVDLINVDLTNANLRGSKLTRVNLFSSILTNCILSGADFGGACLSKANLSNTNFTGANLSFVNLSEANLTQANLTHANLTEANFCLAVLSGVDFRGVKFDRTSLFGAILLGIKAPHSVNWDGCIFLKTLVDKKTFDLIREKHGPGSTEDFILIETFVDAPQDQNNIERSIEFSPEHHQAGVSILNYFGTVVQQKYKDEHIKIRIEQDGLKVIMIVTAPDGKIMERLEETLTKYGLVISGQLPPEKLFDDKMHALALNHKMQMTELELRQTKSLLEVAKMNSKEDREILKETRAELEKVTLFLCEALQSKQSLDQGLLDLLNNTGNRNNDFLMKALDTLNVELGKSPSAEGETKVRDAIKVMEKEDPDMFDKFSNFFRDATASALGSWPSWYSYLKQMFPQ